MGAGVFLGLVLILVVHRYCGLYRILLQYRELKPFVEAVYLVERNYVGGTEREKLLTGAIRGVVESLADPHSVYLEPVVMAGAAREQSGECAGIGILVTVRRGRLMIAEAPVPGSPAAEAGLAAGDVIEAVNGKKVNTLTFETALDLMRGPVGSKMVLTVSRPGTHRHWDVTLERANIELPTVRYQILDDFPGVGYIRILMFTKTSGRELKDSLACLRQNGARYLVLDLRGNPGGCLQAAVEVAEMFVPRGKPILHVKERGKAKVTITSRGSPYLDLPLAVLVDEGSASGAEIVAGAVQDARSGVVVGQRTAGKGSVQTFFQLKNGGGLKLSTARYLLPSGRSLEGQGLVPDVPVEQGAEGADDQLLAALRKLPEVAAAKTGGW
jgi:carboxyl-terminal processing protease